MSTTAKDGYPSQWETRLTLKNGAEIFLRPILPTDEHLLVDLFARMSPTSRYQRFLSYHQDLSEDLLHRFTHVDYVGEFALVGLIREEGRNAAIAVGRYALDPREDTADIALAVRDDWQNLGLGKTLLARLIAIGREHGICRFRSMMDPRNEIMKRILRELGYDVRYYFRDGTYQVEIVIHPQNRSRDPR